ncbi:MDR family MFS transporter [Paenibacillus arenilitoris]|uniref:MFS-type drug efflux transporter P55 n=1 Tax=Paenibacillus arenilitoris TaxID=2772299 RepID=A0A927H7A3_9BACL|nr:MDR family MFS transporter [Paenibacillus arenilitoris]MBD2869389.1 MFS transporter [Paenibacillus arenilitoris]
MKSRTTVMISIVLAMLVASIDTTIMNTTMPVIAEELGRFDLYAWSFASYMIFCTVLAPVAGRISDMFGRKHVFGFGILFFLIGSLLCGLSQNMVQLVAFRAIQGIGAGIMTPFPMIIAGDLFRIEKRGKIQALFTGMWGLSAILAPLLGAFFVEYMNWRWIFYVNLPVCLLAFATLLPYKEAYTPKKTSIDYIGALLFASGVSLILLVTVLEKYQVPLAALGAAVLIAFYYYEKKQPSPIVPLSLVQDPTIRWINLNGFAACAALFGIGSFVPLFLQDIAGESLFMSGLALLGLAIGWMVLSVPAGKWVLRYGYRKLLLIGNGLLVASGILFILIDANTGFWYVFGAMTVLGLGFGLTSTVSMISAQQLVEPHQKGIATSFLMFCRNIGTAVGVTIMGALLYGQSDMVGGFHSLFLFGLIGSVVAFAAALRIRNRNMEGAMKERPVES